jgi:hypothetical protein
MCASPKLAALSASRPLRSKCPNVVDMLDWQTVSQGHVAMPLRQGPHQQLPQREALPLSRRQGLGELCTNEARVGGLKSSDLALREEFLAKAKEV